MGSVVNQSNFLDEYYDFLKSKELMVHPSGFEAKDLNAHLFDFQEAVVKWACRMGRCGVFMNTGLGKTIVQLEFARQVVRHTNSPVLILAPLAVSLQTIQEGNRFGFNVNLCKEHDDIKNGINITNYEKLHKFQMAEFGGIVLDESSILKSYSGKYRNMIIESCSSIPYKISCSATPAPNDYEEIGNQAEFLGVCTRSEMLSMFFINDSANVGSWRLKKHASLNFWKWMCSWSIMIRNPSDIGFDGSEFKLPPLNYFHHTVNNKTTRQDNTLFDTEVVTLKDRRDVRKQSIQERCELMAQIVNESDERWLIWCGLNDESDLLAKLINGSVEVKGAHDSDYKEKQLIRFANGEIKALISKVKIAGYGMNFQICNNIGFVGLSDSFEDFYQAIRRCWRFGQVKPVNVHIITHQKEGPVVENIKRKEKQFNEMYNNIVENMKIDTTNYLWGTVQTKDTYCRDKASGKNWTMYLGDCVEIMSEMESNSIHYSIFSPPFQSLFVYSNMIRDIGNSHKSKDFLKHMQFVSEQLYRIMMSGRLVSFHVMNLPATMVHDGFIGIKDLRGDLIRIFERSGFIFHSEVCIWKDPLIQAVRTKTLTLAHKQVCKDSTRCAQGFADYLITMRKPGENKEPVSRPDGFTEFIGLNPPQELHTSKDLTKNKKSHAIWRRYASPVWMDIDQTRTLNVKIARDNDDEKHLCPLQLDVIDRCLELWSNKGDIILSPFAGIGSEGFCAIKMKRQFVGIELKKSYYDVAIQNLKNAESVGRQKELFGDLP